MELLEIKLRTLTPLWTGGLDGTMDRIHETGILGSLRWWYEVILRGLGGRACDPTIHTCELSGERLKRFESARKEGKEWWTALDEARVCDACKVFGTTGWRKRFRLEVEDHTKAVWMPPEKMLNIRPPGRARGWYLPPGRMGDLKLHFMGEPKVLSLMAALILFLEKWGNLGAKPQLGYGVFRVLNRDEVKSWAQGDGGERPGWKWKTLGNPVPDANLPDLRRFGFFRYQFSPERPNWWTRVPGMERIASRVQPVVNRSRTVPLAPALKNEWRFHRWKGSSGDEKLMFGTLRWRKGDETVRLRSKIAVSWAYPHDIGWEVRGWAWLQKPRIAAQVWDLLRDEDGWQKVLGVRGNLTVRPEGRWQEWTSEDVAQFLEETK